MSIPSIETRSSWVVASVSLVMLATSFGALWIVAVGLKAMAADFGGARSEPSLASSLAWFGSSIGGLMMGPLADRYGIRTTVIFGAVCVCIGLMISTLGQPWQLFVGHGLFMGILGNAGLNAPLYVYVSRWFDRRRGSALGAAVERALLAGTIWPPIFERAIAHFGWQMTMVAYGVFVAVVIVPLAVIFLSAAPELPTATGTAGTLGEHARPRSAAERSVRDDRRGVVPVLRDHVDAAEPSGRVLHRPRRSAQSGAAMLSVLLGLGVLSRQLLGRHRRPDRRLPTLLITRRCRAWP